MAARGFLGAGDLYIARYVGGVAGPYEGPYECTKFEIKPNVNLVEMTSKGRTSYGQVIESVTIPQPADLTVDLPEVNKESLAIALLGTTTALAQTGGALTALSVTIPTLDTWVALSKHSFTTLSLTTSGAVALTLGEDYLVDKQLGWIKILSTNNNSVVGGNSVLVTGNYSTTASNKIEAMTNAQLRARFKLVGKNFADDLPYTVTVHEAVIAADSAFDFLQDDFASISLPGRMKTPAGFDGPATIEQTTSVT